MSESATSLHLTDRQSILARAMFALAGVISIVLPLVRFGDALFSATYVTPYLWLILLGAWSVGILFLFGAIFADNSEITLAGGAVQLKRGNPFFRRVRTLSPGQIAEVSLHIRDLHKTAGQYAAELQLTNGRRYASAPLASRDAAEALVSRLHGAPHAQRDEPAR